MDCRGNRTTKESVRKDCTLYFKFYWRDIEVGLLKRLFSQLSEAFELEKNSPEIHT